jgi:DHA1 family bicyclomycin/chloramphenicol resistance-like MFS transporter
VSAAEPHPARRVPRWMLLVGAMSAIGPVSIDMYLPGFPAIEHEFRQEGVEATMAAYLLGIVVGQLFYGPISDRFGRKPPLYFGFALYALGALGCALATSMQMLIVMRVLQALGGCAGMVIARAIVRDRCEPHEAARVFTTLMMIVALGPVVAPALGGMVVASLGWRATFVFQVLLGVALLIAAITALTESRPPVPGSKLYIGGVARTYARLCTDPAFVGYSLIGGFGMAGMFSYVTGAPTVLTHVYELSTRQFGWLIGLNGLAFMTASRLNLSSLRTLGPEQVIARYIAVPTVLGALLVLLTSMTHLPLWLLVAVQLSFFVSVGRVGPNVAALALAPHGRDAGTASALMGALQSVLATVAGGAVAIFNDGTVRTLTMIMLAGAAGSWLSYLWVRAATKSRLPASPG